MGFMSLATFLCEIFGRLSSYLSFFSETYRAHCSSSVSSTKTRCVSTIFPLFRQALTVRPSPLDRLPTLPFPQATIETSGAQTGSSEIVCRMRTPAQSVGCRVCAGRRETRLRAAPSTVSSSSAARRASEPQRKAAFQTSFRYSAKRWRCAPPLWIDCPHSHFPKRRSKRAERRRVPRR
jgi:hypothetical protein